jgi:hypothetical protein
MFGGMGGLPPGIGMPQDPSGQSQMDQRTFYAFLQGMAFAEMRRAVAMHGPQAQAQPAHGSARQAPAGIDPAMMAYIQSTVMGSNPSAQFPSIPGMPSPLSGGTGFPGNLGDFSMPWPSAAQIHNMSLPSPTPAHVGLNSSVAVNAAPGIGSGTGSRTELAAGSRSPPGGTGRASS